MQGFFNSKLKEKLDILVEIWFANLLWILFCIPVITIPPATFALYHVAQKWVKEEGEGLTKEFFRGLRLYFGRSYLYSFVFLVIGTSVVWYAKEAMDGQEGLFLTVGLGFALFAGFSVLFIHLNFMSLTMMTEISFFQLLWFSLLFAVRHFGLTVLLFLGMGFVIGLAVSFPFVLVFGIFPLTVYLQNKVIFQTLKADASRLRTSDPQ